jgi:hypothetical protein
VVEILTLSGLEEEVIYSTVYSGRKQVFVVVSDFGIHSGVLVMLP